MIDLIVRICMNAWMLEAVSQHTVDDYGMKRKHPGGYGVSMVQLLKSNIYKNYYHLQDFKTLVKAKAVNSRWCVLAAQGRMNHTICSSVQDMEISMRLYNNHQGLSPGLNLFGRTLRQCILLIWDIKETLENHGAEPQCKPVYLGLSAPPPLLETAQIISSPASVTLPYHS